MTLAKRIRILIADDHDIVRCGVRSLIESRAEWELVGEAADGRVALEMVESTRPDICILDFTLPGMNGLTLIRALKRQYPSVEIMIFTMHDEEEIIRETLTAGAKAYVLKSDSVRHLTGAIEALSKHKPYFAGDIAEALLGNYIESSGTKPVTKLTDRERQVVQLIAEGKTNKEVARTLQISTKTAEAHRAAAMQKLGLRGAADLVRYAIKNNIIGG